MFWWTQRVEDPERLTRFLDAIASSDWQNQSREAVRALFDALNDLAHHEILFYYHARKRQRLWSKAMRAFMLVFGTAGLVLPLLAATGNDFFKGWTAYGYVLIALAGACHVANRLFGATGGHIRYVTAQLELERLLTLFRLDWSEWSARFRSNSSSEEAIAAVFPIFRNFVGSVYLVLQEETSVWGKSVSEALQEYAERLDAGRKADNPLVEASQKK